MKRIKIIVYLIIISLFLCNCSDNTSNKSKSDLTITSATNKTETKVHNSSLLEDKQNSQNVDNSMLSDECDLSESTDATYAENQKLVDIFTPLCQYPELPTGCEMTSLTMVLNYYGIDADKCDISDNYLTKGGVGSVDFNVAFVGDPRDPSSYGCYAPVVVNTANSYLAYKNSELLAVNISGVELEDLFSYIDDNTPVIVWGTQDCKEGHYSVTWNVDGQDLTWFTPEHCIVLVGYDDNNIWVADPIYGELRSYDIYTFKNAYNSLNKQAVVLK